MAAERMLVVGLGNPGSKYENTRHNIGFEVIAALATRHGAGGRPKNSFHAEVMDVTIGSQRVLLLAPTTFMNLSGKSVLAARDFYKIENQDVLVICDDINLPVGKLRVRREGSAGGQNGLADVIRVLGNDVPRMRIGVGSPPAGWQGKDYVLGRFTKKERTEMDVTVQEAADAVALWSEQDIQTCMNRYN